MSTDSGNCSRALVAQRLYFCPKATEGGSCGTQTLAGRFRDERAATQNRISQHTAPGTALTTPIPGKWRPDRLSIQAVL